MNELEKAARQYHEAHRATAKAQTAQDRAFKAQAQDPGIPTTLTWMDAVKAQRVALRDEAVALGVLVAAALLVPEVF